MDFIEVIEKRHSVRKYTGEAVPRFLLDEILEEAKTAPSSKNSKSTAFMVLEDRDLIDAVSEMRDRGTRFLKEAPAAIVVLGDTEKSDMWEINSTISATFIQLSAVSKGLGTCWAHVLGRGKTMEDGSQRMAEDYLRELLGIKDNYKVLCVIAVGYESENA